jgi:putative FmdB family regulatory protein
MPIYQYKCEQCGEQKEALQKISDTPLVDCPACNSPSLRKQVTAAAFKLKGTGWYETDFKNSGAKAKPASESKEPKSESTTATSASSATSEA